MSGSAFNKPSIVSAANENNVTIHGDVGAVNQLDLANSDPVTVAVVDGSGNQITSFGGGTQYTEGNTDATITGTAMLMEGATDTLVPVQGTAADGILVNLGSNNDVSVSGTVTVDGSGVTQPVSAASLPLPTGASTAAKQPALGTAGTPSSDVITVQGATSMKPLAVENAPHVGLNGDPFSLVHEAAQYTSQQTSTVLVAGGASEKIVVTDVQVQAYGTTAFTMQLYFGTGAYARGTNRAVFDGEFAPSSTLKPGVVMKGPFISGTNGDDLMVTTSAAGSVTISVWYYVVT